MEIKLPWGTEYLKLDLPDTWELVFPKKPDLPVKKRNELTIVKESLKNPSGMKPLSRMRLKDKKIVIIVDDNTRPTPVDRFFHIILDILARRGASLKNVLVIPALGIHTPMTREEMEDKVGKENLAKVRWENHDAFNLDSHHYFGVTKKGTPIYLNRQLLDADLIILIGLVEPHLWAGFGGGLKNILPGVASAETIGRHHEIIAEPPYRFNRVGVMPEDNSFRLDLEEVREMIGADIFCLNVIIDHSHSIIASFAGDPVKAHREGVKYNYKNLGLLMDGQVDGIIVNSYPMDINLKQGMKCVGNSLPALKPGGVAMGFLKAERGMDDIKLPDRSTPLWLSRCVLRLIGPGRVRGLLERTRKGLNVEEKFLIYYSMQLIRQYDLFLHVPTLGDDEIQGLGFFTGCSDPQGVIDRGAGKLGREARVAVFPEGGITFPIIG